MKKKNPLFHVCGIVFLILAGWGILETILNIIQGEFLTICIASFLQAVGYAAVAVSCYASNKKLMCISYFGIYGVGYTFFEAFTTAPVVRILEMLAFALVGLCVWKFMNEPTNNFNNPRVQTSPVQNKIIDNTDTTDKIEEIEKLARLYSIGAITAEELDAKKKQILGL